jgi:hypothetical protein
MDGGESWKRSRLIYRAMVPLMTKIIMRCAGHVVRMGRRERSKRFWWESPKERDHSKDQGVGGRNGYEWILGWLAGDVEWIRLAQNSLVAGSCDCGDES